MHMRSTAGGTLLAVAWMALGTPGLAQGTTSFEKNTVEAEGATIAYAEAGDPDGAPVLFVHGLPFSSFIWRDVMDEMEGEGRRLIAVDLVGFGDSTGEGYGVLDQVRHLAAFAHALGVADATVVGHDWGAGIGLIYAAQNPEEVAAFAFLEGAMPPVYPRPAYEEMPERIAGMFRSMREEDAERIVLEDNLWLDTILPTMTEAPLPEEVRAEYDRSFPTPASREPLLAMSRSLPIGGEPADVVAAYEDAAEWWTSTTIPKLVIHAEPGRLYPEELARWTAENAANVTVANVGPGLHALQEESPEAVADALSDWLAGLPGT